MTPSAGNQGAASASRERAPRLVTLFTIAGLLAVLSAWVVLREGNLAWDDADYLRDGLRIVGLAQSAGWATPLKAFDLTLQVRPKPPLLVSWIELGGFLLGKRHLAALIVFASVVPFGLLMLATAGMARRLAGPRAMPWAVLVLAASPLALAYGAKVMVETFMGLWTLLALGLMARLLDRPTTRAALLLGSVLAAAMLTKLTVALLLPGPVLVFIALFVRKYGWGRMTWRMALSVALPVLVLAGPWYLENGRVAVRFAFFSSRYNLVAEGQTAVVPRLERLEALAANLPGWPLLLALGGVALVTTAGKQAERTGEAREFDRLVLAGVATGSVVLLLPAYFDPRFLLPIWPALAVVSAGWLSRRLEARPWRSGLAWPAIAGCVVFAAWGLGREPRTTTYWAAGRLIDDLVAEHGIRTLGNIGNVTDWNVSKTGLVNELRDRPGDCFVLHDLSKARSESFAERLGRLDALVVLDGSAIPAGFHAHSPGLNRAHEAAEAGLAQDPRFRRIVPRTAGLPPLSVYVRRR